MQKRYIAILIVGLIFSTMIPTYPQSSSYITVQQDCSVIIYTDNAGNYMAQDCYTNTVITSSTNATAVFIRAIGNMTNGQVLKVREGIYNIDKQITINKGISFIGDGKDKTKFIGQSGIGSNAVLYFNYPSDTRARIAGFTIDNTNTSIVSTAIGLRLSGITQGLVEDIYIVGGSIGMQVDKSSLTRYSSIHIISFRTYGFNFKGDDGSENVFIDVQATQTSSYTPTPTAGFRYFRNSNFVDNGGIYFINCFFSGLGNGLDYGMLLESTQNYPNAPTPIYAWMTQNVASDGVDTAGLYLKNVAEIHISGSWVTATSTGYAIIAEHVHKLQINGHVLASGQEPIYVKGSGNILWRITSTLIESSSKDTIFKFDTGASLRDVSISDVTTPDSHSNIASAISKISTTELFANPLSVYPDIVTRHNMSEQETITVRDTLGTEFHIRTTPTGLEILNSTFVKPNFKVYTSYGGIGTIVYTASCSSTTCTINIPDQQTTHYIVLYQIEKSSNPEVCNVQSRTQTSFTLVCQTTDLKGIRYAILRGT